MESAWRNPLPKEPSYDRRFFGLVFRDLGVSGARYIRV